MSRMKRSWKDPISIALIGTERPGQRAAVLLEICRLLKQSNYRYRSPQRGERGHWIPWAQWLRQWRRAEMRKLTTERIGNDQRTVSSEVA